MKQNSTMKRALVAILFSLPFLASAQFRMVGSGSWTTVNDSTYSATVTFAADLTGNGYLPTAITTDYRVFSQRGQLYRISAASNLTFSTADLTIVERSGDWGTPIGQVMVFDPNGEEAVVQVPFGSTGATAAMQAAVDTYNANLLASGATVADGSITEAKLASSAVTSGKIAANAIDSTKIVNGGISGQDIAQMGATSGQALAWDGTRFKPTTVGGAVSDGDKGDITVSGSGTAWALDYGADGNIYGNDGSGNDNNAIVGWNPGAVEGDDNVVMGRPLSQFDAANTLVRTSGVNSVVLGRGSGIQAGGLDGSVLVGWDVGSWSRETGSSVKFGYASGRAMTAGTNVMIGRKSGNLFSGAQSIGIGEVALYATSGNDLTVVGSNSLGRSFIPWDTFYVAPSAMDTANMSFYVPGHGFPVSDSIQYMVYQRMKSAPGVYEGFWTPWQAHMESGYAKFVFNHADSMQVWGRNEDTTLNLPFIDLSGRKTAYYGARWNDDAIPSDSLMLIVGRRYNNVSVFGANAQPSDYQNQVVLGANTVSSWKLGGWHIRLGANPSSLDQLAANRKPLAYDYYSLTKGFRIRDSLLVSQLEITQPQNSGVGLYLRGLNATSGNATIRLAYNEGSSLYRNLNISSSNTSASINYSRSDGVNLASLSFPFTSAGETNTALQVTHGTNIRPIYGLKLILAGGSNAYGIKIDRTTTGGAASARLTLNSGTAGDSIFIDKRLTATAFRDYSSGGTYAFYTGGTNLALQISGTSLKIGGSTPTARLQLPAGTATASTAPLKLTSGTNLTTPEAGAVEFDGTNLYITPSATRQTIATGSNTLTFTNKTATALQLTAGTATAGTAPLKFNTGTNLTTPEAGAVEYDGTNFFATNSTATRYTLAKTLTATAALDFGGTPIAVNSYEDLTITVTGAASGDAVSIGVPAGSMLANISFFAWVSAADTVTVRCINNDASSTADPASGTFRAVVTKY